MSYVKHNDRSLRHPCKKCGKGGTADESLSLYWAHDTDKPGDMCDKCKVAGRFVLVDQHGNKHACEVSPSGTPDMMPTPSPVPAPSTGSDDAAGKLADLIRSLTPNVDMAKIIGEVNSVVNQRMTEVISAVNEMTKPTIVHVQTDTGEIRKIEGFTHSMLPRLIRVLSATDPDGNWLSALMVGPAGTGKSRLAKQAAAAFGCDFGELALGPQTSKSDILGYRDAGGTYHDTMFRRMYEFGGVMHFDEFDAANPAVVTIINGGTANGHMAFPDGLVNRHPNFRLVCSANTYGNGPDRTYVARQKLDGATKDRFVVLDIAYDLALEDALCAGYGLPEATVKSVLEYVRALRANAVRQQMPLIFGTRATIQSCALLAVGDTWSDVIESRIRCGIGSADWGKVSTGVTVPKIPTYTPPVPVPEDQPESVAA